MIPGPVLPRLAYKKPGVENAV